MLKLSLKNPKKIEIYLSLKLKPQTHPWDMIGEKVRAKHLEETARNQEVSAKQSRKNLFSFKEEPSNKTNQLLIIDQEAIPEPNMLGYEPMFDEPEGPAEGFFLCPFCTCWFTNKKDLKFHVKHWCGR